jgi:hypothetical protein
MTAPEPELTPPACAVWGPLALAIQQQSDAARTYARMLTYFCIGGLGLAPGANIGTEAEATNPFDFAAAATLETFVTV